MKAQVPEEEEAPGAEEAPRREASGAPSLQLVKVEEGPGRGFAGGSEVSLHGGMLSLMGEMLQQMKEQNRQQAEYMKEQNRQQAEFHARSLAQQQQQNERMYELCKAPVHSSPPLGQAQGLPQQASVKVKCEDGDLAYKPVLLLARPGQVGTTLLELLYGLDDLQVVHKHASRATYLPQYVQEQLDELQGSASSRTKLPASLDLAGWDYSTLLQQKQYYVSLYKDWAPCAPPPQAPAAEQAPPWEEYSFDKCEDNDDWTSRCYALCKAAGGKKNNPPWFRVSRGKFFWPWSPNLKSSYPGNALWPMLFVKFDVLPADLLTCVRKKLPEPALRAPAPASRPRKRPAART